MQFLNSIFLYSALAIVIPIALHFWHQKKGKLLDWAAMSWLSEKDSLPSKGIKFEQLLLLFLRCLLVLLFALLLSKPIINWLKPKSELKIHLVEPSQKILDNYKFELETALKNNEKIYWIGNEQTTIDNLSLPKKKFNLTAIQLQKSFNTISQKINNQELNIYFTNKKEFNQIQSIYVPAEFQLFAFRDSSSEKTPYFTLTNQEKIGINSSGKLAVLIENDGEEKHHGAFQVLIKSDKKNIIEAALKSITTVYGINFVVDDEIKTNKKYDILIGNIEEQSLAKASKKALILKTDNTKSIENSFLNHIENDLSVQNSEMIFNGQFPEFLLNKIIKNWNLDSDNEALNSRDLKELFIKRKDFKSQKTSNVSDILLLLFILTLIIERFVALKNKA